MHFAFAARMLRLGTDQCIVQTLVVALAMGDAIAESKVVPHPSEADSLGGCEEEDRRGAEGEMGTSKGEEQDGLASFRDSITVASRVRRSPRYSLLA